MAYPPQQLTSALVIALKETIPWASSLPEEPPVVNPALPVDPAVYQARDRALAYRDLIVGAAVVEASVQVSNVYNSTAVSPILQGAVFPALNFYGSNTGQVNSQVRHVLNASIPWDAARYADADLYGRDALAYEILTRACEEAFTDPPLTDIDASGTLIPSTNVWALAQGTHACADINPSLPMNQATFLDPDQNLADRDNQVAGYVAQLVQMLQNPFQHAFRIYVQIVNNGQLQQEPEVYALISDNGVNRIFQSEPALPNANQIIYNVPNKTLQWLLTQPTSYHVPQIYALAIPGVLPSQTIQTVASIPAVKDAQFWRGKAAQITPNGQSIADTSNIGYTYSGEITGGVLQIPAASLTVPGALTIPLPVVNNGTNRVNLLVKPSPIVQISGGENTSGTFGVNGGADWAVNIGPTSIATETYLVIGGSGIIYNGATYLAGMTFPGAPGIGAYAQKGPLPSTVQQYSVTWNLALPPGTWSMQMQYSDLTGTNTGMGVLGTYNVPGQPPNVIASSIVPLMTNGPAGTLSVSQPNYFNVTSAQTFTLTLSWVYGVGQLHVQSLIFTAVTPTTPTYAFTGALGNLSSAATFTGQPFEAEVVRLDFSGSYSGTSAPNFILSASNVTLPILIEAVDVQSIGTYTQTPVSSGFPGWRQDCLDRAERVIQQTYNQTLSLVAASGGTIPSFRDSGSHWSPNATEQWMSFVEINHPRLREVSGITAISSGFQYQATGTTVYNGGTYVPGNKFYGIAGVSAVSQSVTQVGAFKKSTPGHLGQPCLAPRGLYFNDAGSWIGTGSTLYYAYGTVNGTGSPMAYWDTPFSAPTIVTCQPWMIETGIYSAQQDFWLPLELP